MTPIPSYVLVSLFLALLNVNTASGDSRENLSITEISTISSFPSTAKLCWLLKVASSYGFITITNCYVDSVSTLWLYLLIKTDSLTISEMQPSFKGTMLQIPNQPR